MSEEEIIKSIKEMIQWSDHSTYKMALQGLLDLYNKEKEKNKELKYKCNELNFKYTAQWVDDNFIPKSKILNFINNELPDDEICECCSNYDVNGVRLKNELKKLLEEGE